MPSSISNSLLWIFDAFERDPTYLRRRMFGSDAAYIDGLLCLVAADRDKPWNGLLVCTSQERHAALITDLPALRPHPVLRKWLYVPQEDPAFEDTVEQLTALVLEGDPRVGVEPKPKKRRGKSALPARLEARQTLAGEPGKPPLPFRYPTPSARPNSRCAPSFAQRTSNFARAPRTHFIQIA
ncbi:hypothetical protein QFZ91_007801 [Paraburkholderia sp. JPY419]